MKYGIYAIKDAKTTFMPATVDYNDSSAIRNFEHACESPDSLFFSHSKDFSLYKIGEFDNESGEITAISPPLFLVDAKEQKFVKKTKKN